MTKKLLTLGLLITSAVFSQTTINGNRATVSNVPESAVTNLTTDLSAKQSIAQKGQSNGYASLDGSGKLPSGQMPAPTVSTLGGIMTSPATLHSFLTAINADGSITKQQPACGDLSNAASSCSTDTTNASNISNGTLPAGRLPNPGPSSLGGVKSFSQVTHQFLMQIATDGTVSAAQPVAGDVAFTNPGTGAAATTLDARARDTVNAKTDFGADSTGVSDASTALTNALSAVIASGKKALYIPAGTYSITGTTGTILNLTSSSNGLCVYGDGPGVTILQYAANVTLTGATTVFQVNGTNQCIHDLSILNGSGMSGSFDWTGIAINNGAFSPHLYNIEISGIYGNNLTSGGSGISTFQPYTQTMVNTTVGGSVSTGSQTVTPGNMGFIYVGQRLLIGGTSEAVTVTAKTAATFTATFANSHSSSDTVTSNSQGYQGAIIENCYIHDSFKATAIVLNSSSNVVRGCRIINVGSSTTQHGIYDQGAGNRVESNYIEGVFGYGIHGHKAVPQEDSSGAVYDSNVIVNYNTACIILDSINSDGVNPEVPNGTPLNRYGTITKNTCRQRLNSGASLVAGIVFQAPAVVEGNLLEDACGNTSSCIWLSGTSGGTGSTCAISNNFVSVLNANSGKNQTAISLSQSFCESNHNSISNWNQGTGAIKLNATNVASHGDAVNGSQTVASRCLAINANLDEVSGLHCTSDSIGIYATQAVTGVRIHDCVITMVSSSLKALDASTMQGVISDVQIPTGVLTYGTTDPAKTLTIRNIDGQVKWNNTSTAGTAVPAMGRLLDFPASTNVITQGLGVKLDGTGNVANNGTSDTTFIGWALSGKTSTSGNLYIAGGVGTEIQGWATDGAWTAGDYGILSGTSGGKLHDNGTSPPASGSYVLFLDTGGSAGNARVLVLKTL